MDKQQKQAFEVLSKRIVDEADVARLDAFLQGKDIKESTSKPCMNEEQALQELNLDKLIEHCKKQCKLHKGSKMGYEHYIFLQLLENAYDRDIEDYIIDYSLIIKGELSCE